MSLTLRIIVDVFIGLGCFFAFAGAVGLIRMPDAFSRMQSSTNISTFGILLALIGGLIYTIFQLHSWEMSAKIAIIGIITIIANPVSGHAIARAAYRRGVMPEKPMVCDDMVPQDEQKEGEEE